jgi:tetratricopeptide (TPR) repeat protein
MASSSFDVFLSHSWRDNTRTDGLCAALERAGVTIWYDREDQRDFESITRAIADGLSASRSFLAFYSHDYPTRRACQYELTAAFVAASHEGDPRRRVLVLNPEEGLTHILPVELRDALIPQIEDWLDDKALDQLVQRIVSHIERLSTTIGEIVPLAPPRWVGVQALSAPRFVGRSSQMWHIHSALHSRDFTPATGRSGPSAAILVGLAGVGKTLLTEEYALRFGSAFPGGVFWLRSGDGNPESDRTDVTQSLRDQLLDIARVFQLDTLLDVLPTSELRAFLGAAIDRAGEHCLWIVDDVPAGLSADEFRAWLPPSLLARALFVTRSAEYSGLADQVEIGVLDEDEALMLLTSRREPAGESEHGAAVAIVATLGGHALAVDVAGAALESFAGLQSFADFHRLLLADDEDALELVAELAPVLPTGHERSIAKTLLGSIRQVGSTALDYLRIASWISTAPISPALTAAVLGAADHPDGEPDRVGVARALRDLDRHSLTQAVEEPEGARTVHPLVCRVVAFTERDLERREYLRQATVHVLSETLAQWHWRAGDVGGSNALAHARRLIADPKDLLTTGLMGIVGRADFERGDPKAALRIFEIQREATAALGAGLEEELAVATNIGGALFQLGRLAEAQVLYTSSLERARQDLPESAEVITALLHGQATILRESGDFAAARSLHEEVFSRIALAEGAESRHAVTEMSNLAGAIEAQGHLEEALEMQQRVLELRQRDIGGDDSLTLNTLNNVSTLYRKLGMLAKARPLAEYVLETRQRVLGDEHPSTIGAKVNLAVQCAYEGDYERALQLETEALAYWRARGSDAHPSALTSANNIADTLANLGRKAEALEIQSGAATLARKTYGEDSPLGLRTTANYAALLRAVGELGAAADLQTSLLSRYEATFGEDHHETLILRGNVAPRYSNSSGIAMR